MTATPGAGEPGRDLIGDHSWNMHTVLEDDTEVDLVAACVGCHTDANGDPLTSFDDLMAREDHDGDGEIEGAQHEIEGLIHDVAMLLPPVGVAEVDIRDPLWNDPGATLQRKAAWNWLMIEEDGSHGVHNYQFAVALLKLTKQALEYGVLEPGSIMGIADVPNDQGRQLMVDWNRFGGDGASDTPLQDYYVWRRVDGSMGKFNGTVYESLDKVPTGLEDPLASVGSMAVTMDGHLWTAVGHQPAFGVDLYSTVVPTLGDATTTDTTWSVFKVSGHAEDSQIFVASMPDSAYSVDNLVPTAPTLSVDLATGSQVDLTLELDFENPLNVDFNYFELYRSLEQGFDPLATEPIATFTGTTYTDADVVYNTNNYYRVVAVDFSGNRGDFSGEVMAAVGVGIEETVVPEVFALHQNYPNPFGSNTTITFDVPLQSDVSVILYDLLGREVKTLVNGSVPIGRHRVTVNATDWSSGLYVARYETPDGTFSRTMMLVK
jgi:hypothetical protein